LTCFQTSFDFILAQSIFSHAGPRDIQICLMEAAACLESSGLFVASFVLDRIDYDGAEWVYPTCVGYRDSTMRHFAQSAGLDFRVIDWPHPNAQTWALFWQRNAPGRLPNDPSRLLFLPAFERIAPQLVDEESGVGFFDGLWDVGDVWLAYGWAIAREQEEPPSFVIIVDGTRIIAAGRVDVAVWRKHCVRVAGGCAHLRTRLTASRHLRWPAVTQLGGGRF
jgi:hypothetical protein